MSECILMFPGKMRQSDEIHNAKKNICCSFKNKHSNPGEKLCSLTYHRKSCCYTVNLTRQVYISRDKGKCIELPFRHMIV